MQAAADLIPMRWPDGWPATSPLIEGTPVNRLIRSGEAEPQGVAWLRTTRWPSVRVTASGSVGAGPTGTPWIDSNGWRIRLAQSREPSRPVWLAHEPPQRATLADYRLAIAEAGAWNARWIVSLDAAFRDRLARNDTAALADWRRITADLEFFERRREWRTLRPAAVMGIWSDFAGPNQALAGEVANLLTRRYVCWRVVDQDTPLSSLRAVVYIDAKPPAGPTAEKLLAFARGGGTVVAPAGLPLDGQVDSTHPRFDAALHGKGRVAVARGKWSDPFQLAADAHLLMSRAHDPLRLWNAGSVLAHFVLSEDGKRGVVHLVNYSTREASHLVTLGLAQSWRRARWISPESSQDLTAVAAARGIELRLPPIAVYAAVEVTEA